MLKGSLFRFIFILLIIIAVLHAIALQLYLYWIWRWFDVPMHFLGGLWVALSSVWLYFKSDFIRVTISQNKLSRIFAIMSSVLIAGLVWEVFELLIGVGGLEKNYIADTTLDLIMDIMGGLLGVFLFYSFDFDTLSFVNKENL